MEGEKGWKRVRLSGEKNRLGRHFKGERREMEGERKRKGRYKKREREGEKRERERVGAITLTDRMFSRRVLCVPNHVLHCNGAPG